MKLTLKGRHILCKRYFSAKNKLGHLATPFPVDKIKAVTKLHRQIPSWITDLKLAMNIHRNCVSDIG